MVSPTQPLRLVIFDVDGTLIDSQDFILAAMRRAFDHAGKPAPTDEATLGIVGLSLPQAMEVLVPGLTDTDRDELVQLYKDSFLALRQTGGGEAETPFYPGARDALERLDSAGYLLSILVFCWGCIIVARRVVDLAGIRVLGAVCFVVSFAFLLDLAFGPEFSVRTRARDTQGGAS